MGIVTRDVAGSPADGGACHGLHRSSFQLFQDLPAASTETAFDVLASCPLVEIEVGVPYGRPVFSDAILLIVEEGFVVARAVIARPQLLLADEPTGNVDPNLAQRLLRLFVELHKSGTSVVIATHDIALMDRFDARRLVLHEGRLHVYD